LSRAIPDVLTRLQRALLRSGAIVLFLVLAGATYQGVATAVERRQFPQPGQLVDVGGHQLHIHCIGEGTPTVVLEAPATGMSAAWGWVQPEVAKLARTCSYDRAGLGWSEAGDRPYDPSVVPDELRALLAGAKQPKPYLLVGQGLGAAFARVYGSKFGGDLTALVLIDLPSAGDTGLDQTVRLLNVSPWLARTGILRATRMLSNHAAGLPGPPGGALSAFLNRPDHLTRAAHELARWDQTVELARGAPLRHDLPVVQIEIVGSDRVALLSARSDADRVTAAIRDTLTAASARHR
jgi:pimeloyl-ACP methyl ester carboxylesterase